MNDMNEILYICIGFWSRIDRCQFSQRVLSSDFFVFFVFFVHTE